MTQEDKELLLRDLTARLSYGVKGIITYDKSNTTFIVEGIDNNVLHLSDAEDCYVEDFKPYLRPMSSMTEEEYTNLCISCTWLWFENDLRTVTHGDHKCYDWLNKHHFDYRGLIPMGLAIDCTKLDIDIYDSSIKV